MGVTPRGSEQTEITPEAGSVATTGGYVTVQDESGAIQVDIPAEWTQVDGQPWIDGETVLGASITASADLEAFTYEYYQSGLFFAASSEIAKLGGYVQILDVYRESYRQDCDLTGRYDYEDSAFEGKYDLFTNCLGQENALVVLSARPINDPTSMIVILVANMITDADFDALDQIFATFDVVGYLP